MATGRCLTLLAVAWSTTACAERPDAWTGEVSDSAGVRVVANPTTALWSASEGWIAVEDLRIGALDDPGYQFGRIAWIDVGEAGDIYVLDQLAHAVRVFAADGTFLRQFGRPGEGPGELGRNTRVLAVGPGDTVVVADPPRGLHRYGPDGAHVGTVPFEEPAWSGETMWGVGEGGSLALQAREYYYWSDPPQDLQEPVVLLGPNLSVLDTLGPVPIDPWHLERAGQECTFQPYQETYTWAVEHTTVLHVASTVDYRVRTYERGRLRRIVTKRYEPVPLDGREQDVVIQAQVNRWKRNGMSTPEMIARRITRFCFPDALPPISSVHVGPGGTLWVARPPRPSSLLDESSVIPRDWAKVPGADWDVFDAEGRFMGTVEFPDGFRAFAFREGTVHGVWQDGVGVPYVLRFRLAERGTR